MGVQSSLLHFLVAALLVLRFNYHFADTGTCADGRFGENCEFQCHCAGGSTCTDGICDPDSCDDSWEGYKCQIGKNIARNKNVSLSSIVPHWNRSAQLAVDGNKNRDFYRGGSCVSTSKEKTPWLKIDLGDTYVVQEVTIATVGRGLFYVRDTTAQQGGGTRLFPELPGNTLVSYSRCLERCMNTTGCIATTSCTNHWSQNGCWKVPEKQRYAYDCKHSVKVDTKLQNLYLRVGNAASPISDNRLCKSTQLTIPGDTEKSVLCDQMAIGRYVFLQMNNTDDRVLAVCEVMVKGYLNAFRNHGKNIAKGKTVSVSSTLSHWNRDKQLAVDGNRHRDFYYGRSCVSTGKEKTPWLRIDLGDIHLVHEVSVTTVGRGLFNVLNSRAVGGGQPRLFPELSDGNTLVSYSACLERCMNTTGCNATNSCTRPYNGNGCWKVPETDQLNAPWDCKYSVKLDTKLKNLYIRVGNSARQISDNSLCKSTPLTIPGDTEQSISCDQTVIGRYIVLQLNNHDDRVLAVCEVMAKGYKFVECKRGLHGTACDKDCPDTCGNGTNGCNKLNAVCCSQYKTGVICEKDLPKIKKSPWKISTTSTSITLAWDKWKEDGSTGSGVGPVTKYIIQYKEKTTSKWLSKDVQTQNGLIVKETIEKLEYNTQYLFRIACYLTDGLGDVHGEFTGETKIKTTCKAPSAFQHDGIQISSTLDGTSKATLNISWSAIGDGNSGCDHIEKYKVKYRRGRATPFSVETVNGNMQHSLSIKGLLVYTEYSIIVEAYNNEGNKSASNTLTHTTIQGISEAVSKLQVASPASDQLRVTWITPTEPRGVITEYKLQYRQVGMGDCDNTTLAWSQTKTKGANDVEHVFTGLYPYRNYQVKIFPVNAAGTGKNATTLNFTQQSVPSGVPKNVEVEKIRRRSATLKWTKITCDKRNGVLTSYRYQIEGVLYSTINRSVYTNSTALSVEISSLTPFALYTVKVAAVTEAGPGTLYSNEVTFRTLEDVPPAPRNVIIPGSGPTSLYVDWTGPYPPHGVIHNYEIEYKKEDDSMNHATNKNLTEFKIEDLETSVNYSIRVRAKTNAGWGAWSAKVFGFTEEVVPSAPLSFKLIRRTISRLSFSWKEPKYPNGVITGYKLTCNEATSSKEVSNLSRETTLEGLRSETLYLCSILAKTSAGYGSPSAEILSWTQPNPPTLLQSYKSEEPTITDSTIAFQVPVFKDHRRINKYEVYVDKEDLTRNRRAVLDQSATNFTGCDEKPSQRDVYITAKIRANQAKDTFIVGDGNIYEGLWNCPLIKNNTYSIFFAAVLESLNGDQARTFVSIGTYKIAGQTHSECSCKRERSTLNTAALIIGVVLGLLCIALSCALIVMMVKMKRLLKREADRDKQYTDLKTFHHTYSGIEKMSVGTLEEFKARLNGESAEYENPKDIDDKPVIYEEVKDVTK